MVALGLIDPWLAVVFLAGAPLLALLLRALARDTSGGVAALPAGAGADRRRASPRRSTAPARSPPAGTADRDTAPRSCGPLPELSRGPARMWRVQGRAAAQAAAVAPLLHLASWPSAGVLLTRHRLSVGEVLAASRYAVLATGIGVLVGQLSGLARCTGGRSPARRESWRSPRPAYGDAGSPAGRSGHGWSCAA